MQLTPSGELGTDQGAGGAGRGVLLADMDAVGAGLADEIGPVVQQEGDAAGLRDRAQRVGGAADRVVRDILQAKLQRRDVAGIERGGEPVRKRRGIEGRWRDQVYAAAFGGVHGGARLADRPLLAKPFGQRERRRTALQQGGAAFRRRLGDIGAAGAGFEHQQAEAGAQRLEGAAGRVGAVEDVGDGKVGVAGAGRRDHALPPQAAGMERRARRGEQRHRQPAGERRTRLAQSMNDDRLGGIHA